MKTRIFLIGIMTITFYTNSLSVIKPTFHLKNKEATMPVVVRGKMDSDILILFLHGGPGGTAMKKIGTRAFNGLEEEFGVVYWDQRGATGSQGGTQKKYMNLNQFIEDLDVLIDKIRNLYPTSQLFLMGHSWGGGFGTAYLTDPIRQSKIAGWIEVAGAHNNPKGDSLSAVWVKNHAKEKIMKGEHVQYWKRALKWYEKNPRFDSNAMAHYNFVRKSHGYQSVEGDSLGQYPGYVNIDILRRPVRYVAYYFNFYQTLNKFIISDIDLTP
jgi:pimeloyl-ACP methyl ester carboxylesterase